MLGDIRLAVDRAIALLGDQLDLLERTPRRGTRCSSDRYVACTPTAVDPQRAGSADDFYAPCLRYWHRGGAGRGVVLRSERLRAECGQKDDNESVLHVNYSGGWSYGSTPEGGQRFEASAVSNQLWAFSVRWLVYRTRYSEPSFEKAAARFEPRVERVRNDCEGESHLIFLTLQSQSSLLVAALSKLGS